MKNLHNTSTKSLITGKSRRK